MTTSEIQAEAIRAALVRDRLAGGRAGTRSVFTPVDRAGPLSLAFGQQQMWFLNRLEPDSAEYLVPLALRLRGPLDTAALGHAWDAVLARHEILRTRYRLSGGEPDQVIDPPQATGIQLVDLTDLPAATREATAFDLAAREPATPFDLERQWPARATLLRLTPDDHLFVAVFHHIACDAWSIGLFAEELSTNYTASRAGRPAPLAPLPVQYADYAAWERTRTTGTADLDYWRDQLADLTPLDLPADRPRPAVRSWAGASVPFTVPQPLAARLRVLGREHGATPFMVLLTALQVLLSRYTGKNDIAVGTVVSGRTRPELRQLIGYGINTLVLRARWTDDPTFATQLDRTRETVLTAFDHQDVPFARLVDDLQPDRDMSRTPIFGVALTMHESQTAAFALPQVEVSAVAAMSPVARFDLTVQVEEAPDGGLHGAFEYATSLFDEARVARMAGHLVSLLWSVVRDPGTAVSRLSIMDADELALVTDPPVVGTVAEPSAGGVHQTFEARAAATPDATAVVYDDVRLTYAELNERANRLAHHLRSLGVVNGSLVGVCLHRGPDLVPALLAVLKAGAAYLPLDPAVPDDRLAFMVADAGVSVVVTESSLADRLSGVSAARLVTLDQQTALIARQSAQNPVLGSRSDDLMYVIYTSGSTGRPKGVCLTHANVARLLAAGADHYGFTAADVWPLFHSYAFDVSVWELWGALLFGGRLVVVPQAVTRSPDDLLDLLIREGVTVLNQTPSAFRGLVALARQNDPRLAELRVRAVVFAGERLDLADLAPWVDRFGPDEPALVNMYGITETTVHTTYHRLSAEDFGPAAGNRVGYPLADLRVYLLDPAGELVPVGVPGEIHVGGPGVARGYLDRPALTASRFVPDPFDGTGARLYRSGDLARRRPDGSLEFLGRIDDQVKIRGYRIELGEIQATLLGHPRISDAIVVLREDTLIGYLVGDDLPTPADLRALLARTLPEYMIPAAYVGLDRIPLTANGKLDRRALPAPGRSALAAEGGYLAPRTPAEERIAAVWRDVLGLEQVGVQDSFFDLGGHSIRAVALVGALRAIGFDIAVRDVFAHRTVADLAELTAGRTAPAEEAPVEPFALISAEDRARLPDGVTDAYPLSGVQAGMVVEMLTDGDVRAYHNVTSFRILDDAPFSLPALREAARIVVARHEILRTSIDLTSYRVPMQLVHATAEMPVGGRSLRDLDDAAVDRALREFTARERADLFDLDVPPLLRLFGHTCDGNTWWLSVSECHAIIEGWSHHSLLMEILDCYRRIRDGAQPEPVVAPAVRYADFIAAELRSLASTEDRAYWGDIVGRHARLALPTGWGADPTGPRESVLVGVAYHDLDADLRALATRCRASLKSVLLAAHLKVLSQLTNSPSFHTGLVLHGRPEVLGADRVYGMYLNSLPFVYDRGSATWQQLIERVFAQETELWPHRRFPMPAIQREFGDGERLLDVRFSLHDFDQVDRDLVDYMASIDDSPTEFPLAVAIRLGYVTLTFNSHIVNRVNADRIGAMYRAVLESMAADPAGDARATYLPPATLAPVVPAAPVTHSVLERFEAQVISTPDAVAIGHAGAQVTYLELDTRANRLAHHLRTLDVTVESTVGVLLDRGPDLFVAFLAVWKAGAAYVPLDPSYPANRVTAMLADAGARVILTHSDHADRCAGVPVRVLLDTSAAAVEGCPPSRPVVAGVGLDGLAYVVFTSGSTGRPKGVLVTHRGLANHVDWAGRELASRGSGGAPLFSSVAFDLVVPVVWGPLVCGQRVFVVGQDVDLAELGGVLVGAGPFSFMKLTPGHLDVLSVQLGGAVGLASVVVVAGEVLSRRSLDRWRVLDPDSQVINEYGPTEASVGTCIYPVDSVQEGETVPIGRPLPNMTMHVLDEAMERTPIGVLGELYVGGVGVARGYVGRPDLTAERFVPGPRGTRLYRTGDVVRMLPSGDVDFVGRVDDQVKIRGYRIELGEIQAVLLEHPGVAAAVVVVDAESLVAYWVPAGDDTPDLAAHCGRTLPEYMVPAVFVPLEKLPLNANGKVDRRALPAAEPAVVRTAPRNPVEERIAAVWRAVLERDEIGVHDSFFDLGGHSIRAVALVGALRAAGFEVAVRDVFEHRTVAELAVALAGDTPVTPTRAAVAPMSLITAEDRALVPDGVTDAYPASLLQLGMLVQLLADEQLRKYHNTTTFRIRDPLPFSLPALQAAARVVVSRHELLRTSFDLTSYSVPMQLVHASAEMPVVEHDLRRLDDAGRERALREWIAHERATAFDLAAPPLLRMAALIESDGAWRLGFTQCHAITEGWSQQSLLMEVLDCYRHVQAGTEPVDVEPPAVRYADFIAGELESLASSEDQQYWAAVVTDHARFALPAGWGSAEREDYRVPVVFTHLEADLRALAATTRTSLKSVLLAAHLTALGMLTEEKSFFTGLVHSVRPEAEGADRVYGMYLNTLPFAYDRTAATWRTLVERVFDQESALWPHRRFPLPAIQRQAGGRRLLGVMFSYQDFHQVDTDVVDVRAGVGDSSSEFDLAVSTGPGHLVLRTSTDQLTRPNLDRLAGMYLAVLTEMAADPDGDAQASHLSDVERQQTLVDWNDTAVDWS